MLDFFPSHLHCQISSWYCFSSLEWHYVCALFLYYFFNPSLTWGYQPVFLPHPSPWFQPFWVALFLLVIKTSITVRFLFFPENLSKPILKPCMAFWSYVCWKNTVEMTNNLWSGCQVNLQMPCLYLLILFEVFFSSLSSSSALLICVEKKMHSALMYL